MSYPVRSSCLPLIDVVVAIGNCMQKQESRPALFLLFISVPINPSFDRLLRNLPYLFSLLLCLHGSGRLPLRPLLRRQWLRLWGSRRRRPRRRRRRLRARVQRWDLSPQPPPPRSWFIASWFDLIARASPPPLQLNRSRVPLLQAPGGTPASTSRRPSWARRSWRYPTRSGASDGVSDWRRWRPSAPSHSMRTFSCPGSSTTARSRAGGTSDSESSPPTSWVEYRRCLHCLLF